MSEMVERVARASFAFWKQQNSRVADFEDMNPEELEFAMAHARAMIVEMREPTVEMVVAAYAVVGIPQRPVLANGYRAMIDEASK